MDSDFSLADKAWLNYMIFDPRYRNLSSSEMWIEGGKAIFWGSLSILCAFLVVYEHSARHQLQTVISFDQLRVLVLRCATCCLEKAGRQSVSSLWSLVRFWNYYVSFTDFSAVIPLLLIYQSTRASIAAFRTTIDEATKPNSEAIKPNSEASKPDSEAIPRTREPARSNGETRRIYKDSQMPGAIAARASLAGRRSVG